MGQVYTFSWFQIVRGAVDILVVLQVPKMIVYFVAMYLMGPFSQVYRNTARTKLNIYSKFHSAIAKVLLAEVAFRGLVNNFTDRMTQLASLTPPLLYSRLADVFQGYLQSEQVLKLAAVVFHSMDKDNSDEISCKEFIHSSTDDGEISLSMMTRFFEEKTASRFARVQRILAEQRKTVPMSKSLSRLFTPHDSSQSLEMTIGSTFDIDDVVGNLGDECDQEPTQHQHGLIRKMSTHDTDGADSNEWT